MAIRKRDISDKVNAGFDKFERKIDARIQNRINDLREELSRTRLEEDKITVMAEDRAFGEISKQIEKIKEDFRINSQAVVEIERRVSRLEKSMEDREIGDRTGEGDIKDEL